MEDDTLQLMEELLVEKLIYLQQANPNDDIKDDARIAIELSEKINEARRIELEYAEKKERRQHEIAMAEIASREEAETNKKRMRVEIMKVTIPVGISALIGWLMQKRSFKFEETGSISSYTARESCHLPKLWK